MLLDGNDPLIRDHFGLALKVAHANSRIVFRIRWRDDLLERIAAGPAWLTVSRLARWLGCSKPTVRNYLRLGLLRARRRKRTSERELIARESAHLLVQLCRKLDSDWWPQGLWAFSRINKRLHQEGTGVEFAKLGSVSTIPIAMFGAMNLASVSHIRIVRSDTTCVTLLVDTITLNKPE